MENRTSEVPRSCQLIGTVEMKNFLYAISTAGAAVLLTVFPADADPGNAAGGFDGHGMWGGGFMGPFMSLFWIVAIVLVIVILFRSIPSLGRPTVAGDDRQGPLRILQERFARGEIDREEFLERKKLLEE